MSHISTAGYGTFADATPTGTTTTSSVTPHPWREFLDRSVFSCPYFYDDVMIGVRRNLSHFCFNYATVTLHIVFLSLL
ncbi:PRA1 family protein E [Glycine max]|nr:hypothetical protein GYH30_031443 [Glycine max]KAH1225722.1 PRA1 family protein E [Glycine max]